LQYQIEPCSKIFHWVSIHFKSLGFRDNISTWWYIICMNFFHVFLLGIASLALMAYSNNQHAHSHFHSYGLPIKWHLIMNIFVYFLQISINYLSNKRMCHVTTVKQQQCKKQARQKLQALGTSDAIAITTTIQKCSFW
jgi:hypothetical protein